MNPRLTPELVLSAYCQGCFPMADPETGEISFYEPDPRALIPLDERFHIPHGLKRVLNKKPFELRMDTAFPDVVHACARTDEPEEQWIDGRRHGPHPEKRYPSGVQKVFYSGRA